MLNLNSNKLPALFLTHTTSLSDLTSFTSFILIETTSVFLYWKHYHIIDSVKQHCKPNAIVTDRYSDYKAPTKSIFSVKHIRVANFKNDISNNIIETFNKQFKYRHNIRYGFNSFESDNSIIMMFVFFYNFIRPHSSLSNLTPTQVAGLKYSEQQQNSSLLVS